MATADSVSFVVPGIAVPKQSFRATRNGHGYQPQRVTDWERTVAWHARIAMQGREPMAGPVAVRLVFCLPTHRRVDCENLAKPVNDALTGIVWNDDSQVVELNVVKRLGSSQPDVFVAVRAVSDGA
jgi:Holliday junction resolvase RusA-like endonuclease